MLPILTQANVHAGRDAIHSDGKSFSYDDVVQKMESWISFLLDGKSDLNEERVAFCITPGFDYVTILWAIWQAGGIAVPLHTKVPIESLKYTLEDSEASILIVSDELKDRVGELASSGIRFISVSDCKQAHLANIPNVSMKRRAMMLYTSGTTGKPKGVVTTHSNIDAQIKSLVSAWKWSQNDKTINVLPLHHVHGIINVVSCCLWSGGSCLFPRGFDEEKVFSAFLHSGINVFMAVPTIYHKLITFWEGLEIAEKEKITNKLGSMRLMVSGSAALPVSVLEKWRTISGQTLLERYGMTEIGMAISNPYRGERRPGFIGQSLPGVRIKLIDDQGKEINGDEESGEILVKGPNVFKEYWKRENATEEAFTIDGWFKTGDVAMTQNGSYKILGRKSADIIKSGGYKLSALEIEEVLRTHSFIGDCAVVGVEDEEWGEIVTVAYTAEQNVNDEELKVWLKEKLPAYKIPRKYLQMENLPRNAMGKVVKKEVKKLFQ